MIETWLLRMGQGRMVDPESSMIRNRCSRLESTCIDSNRDAYSRSKLAGLADHDADLALSVAEVDEGGFDGPTFFANPGEEAVTGLALGFGDDPPSVAG